MSRYCIMKSKRSLIALIAALFFLLSGKAYGQQHSYLEMGVNVNERPHWLKSQLLKQSQTTWVRAFIEASHYIKGKRDLDDDFRIRALKNVAKSGRKIILSIKWDLNEAGWHTPKPGSNKEKQWFRFAGHLVKKLDGDLSIIVLVNEITIDTPEPDLQKNRDGIIPFVRFQKRLLSYISKLNPHASDGKALPIYTGGFTRLDLRKQQERPVNKAMFKWINKDDRITGADFHIHQPDYKSSARAVDFIRKQIPQKPLIVTEFSLIWKWKAHLGDRIGSTPDGRAFSNHYDLDPNLTVAEFYTNVFSKPVSEKEWQAFLKSQPWFEPNYLDVMGRLMEKHGVVVATYAFTINPDGIGPRKVTPHSTPWFINQLLLPNLVFVKASDRVAENYGLFESFVRWQKITKDLKATIDK